MEPIEVLSGVRVPMRDGVALNLRITRPVRQGRYPAVMEYNPYRRLGPIGADGAGSYPPVVPYLAAHGYVVVQFDVRGTGSSGGFSTDIYSADERQDGFDMVGWIAAQPWCTGLVGMIGKSYGAVVQWQVAAQAPPALKAIVVRSGGVDLVREFSTPGGAIRPWMFEYYAPLMNALNFAPPDPDLVGDDWAALWQQRLDASAPWSLGYLRNLDDGPYWRDRSLAPDFLRVQAPVLLVEGWPDWYASAELRAFRNLSVPRKVLIGPWGHYYAEEADAAPGPRIDTRPEVLRWLDRWLKGIENGVEHEPPVTVFVRGWQAPSLLCVEDAGEWRNEAAWPPQDMQPTVLHLAEAGLQPTPGKGARRFDHRASFGVASGRRGLGLSTPWGMPTDQRPDDAFSLCYDTPPLAEPMVLLGAPQAVLSVTSSAPVVGLNVRLCDVAPDGASRLITDGFLLGTHRDGHPAPLTVGERHEVRIALLHCAYGLQAGHRLRVAVSSADFQNAWPAGMKASIAVHETSHVILPVAPPGRDHLPPPCFAPAPQPFRLPTPPIYRMQHDLVEDSVTCELQAGEPSRRLRSRYTVSNADPASVAIESACSFQPPHQRHDIQIEATCRTTSDADAFHHRSDVAITVDGAPRFRKSWAESVARRLR